MRKKLTMAIAAVACCGAVGASQAQATQYASKVYVVSGASYFGPYVLLYLAETVPNGSALGCAGISGVGMSCSSSSYETSTINTPWDVESEPYIHDHSGWNDYFSGYYYV
jgi:hypothetical protein